MTIKQKANSMARKYNSRNPLEIIKNLNVILVYYPLKDVRGFYQFFQRNNIIYIDDNLPENEQIVVCAHELGHMLLHKNSNALFMDTRTHFVTTKYENEADRFAINLLISDDDIENNLEYTVNQLSRLFGYHERLIELRLQDITAAAFI